MDLDEVKYFRSLSTLKKILKGRDTGTWIGIFTPSYVAETKLIQKLKEEFPQYRFVELNLKDKPKGQKISAFIRSHIKPKQKKLDTIVLLRGLSALLAESDEILKQLNFERESLFALKDVIVFLMVNKSDKSALRFKAGDFWDWLQYKLDFDIEEDLFQGMFLEVTTKSHNIKSAEEAKQNIKRLLTDKKRIENSPLSEKRKVSAILNIDLQLIENYYFLSEYDKALEIAFNDLELLEKFKDEKVLAEIFERIALIYRAKGDLDKALEYALKALEIFKQVLGVNHPSLATSYNNIAMIYKDKGDLDKALEYALKDLKITEQVLGENHPDTATSYNNIALIYRAKGDLDKALEYALKALQIREQVLGENHPFLATFYDNIAVIYQDKGDLDKALEYALKALEIRQQVLGVNHPDTATSYNNISTIYYSKGDLDKALEYALKANEIFKQVLGENHPDTAISYYNIARIYYDLGEKQKAYDYISKAVEILEKTLGSEHPHTIHAKLFKLMLAMELGKMDEIDEEEKEVFRKLFDALGSLGGDDEEDE